MVYRSFGLPIDLKTIAVELERYESKLNRAKTFHLSRNAVEHGLAAIPCRLRDPWRFVTEIFEPQHFRLILNHRIRPDSPLGHYSVFLGANIENKTVCVHDPQSGPERIMTKTELLDLWTPFGENCEITGNIAVLVSENVTNDVVCVKCGERFSLQPFAWPGKNSFKTVFCPWCDRKQCELC